MAIKALGLSLLLFLSLAMPLKAVEGDRELATRARGSSAMTIQFMAADLLDELVYGWTKQSPLGMKSARVALMGVSVPVGLNAHLASLLETHITELLIKNPQAGVIPVYCGACVAITSYSISNRTVIARGAEIPELAETLKTQADYALYLDFEGQGAQLVLRAHIVSLADNRIVYGRSLAIDSGQPPLLRRSPNLLSAEDARDEYIDILESRKRLNLTLGLRVSIIRTKGQVLMAPFVWGSVGMETFINHRKKWLADLKLGVSSIKNEHNAWQLSSRVYRLLNADQVDLMAPDVYVYAGLSYWEISGQQAVIFQDKSQVSPGSIAAKLRNGTYDPKAHNTGFILGIEVRLADFMRLGCFVETFGNQSANKNLKTDFHSYGFELGVIL